MTRRAVLVTGANRGIGLAAAQALATKTEVCQVIVAARQEADAHAAARSVGDKAKPIQLDLSSPETRKRDIAALLKAFPAIDAVINNAGVLEQGSLLEVSDEKLRSSFEVNVDGPLALIRAIAPGMVARGYGRIVNVSSGWGAFAEGLTGPAAYSITKAALNAVTVVAAQGLPKWVKINSCCPGWVRTRMGGAGASLSPEEGADTPVWLATLPEDGPSGKFFRRRTEIAW